MRTPLKLLPLILPLVLCLLLFAQSETKAQGDITPPVVVSLSVSPSVVDTRYSSQVVTVTAHITDDLSGLGSYAFWIGPQIIEHAQDKGLSFRDADRIEGTPRDGIYINTVTLPQYSAEGRWVAKYSVIYDVVGNQSSCNANGQNICPDDWDAFYFDNVDETKAQGDITPPVVVSLSVSPSVVDTRYSSQVVTVTAHITDDLSGLGSYAFWIGPQIIEHAQDKGLSFRDADRIEGTPRDGIYINTVTLPQYSAEGRWVAKYSVIYDVVGNQSSCNANGQNICPDDWDAFYFFNVQDSFFLYLPSLSRD